MSKQQMIELIQQRNRTARPEFLMKFEEPALRDYLERLTVVLGRRGRGSVWVRQGRTPASSAGSLSKAG